MSVNKVILIGNVGVDPEIRYIDTRPLASFSPKLPKNSSVKVLACT